MPARRVPQAPPELREFLASYAQPVQQVALRARAMILALEPGLVEKVWLGWKAIGYSRTGRMTDMVFGIGPATAHVGLHIASGTTLPDPAGLLRGTGKTSRHVRITSIETLESAPVQALIEAALRQSHAPVNDEDTKGWQRPVSDEAVAAATGRRWDEWIAALDAAGCAQMSHREIAAIVGDRFAVGPWWRQAVTVGYERARGLREVHQTPAGYQVGVSRTIHADVAAVWQAWSDARMRMQWLPPAVTLRKATEPKSMRITWHDGSDLHVLFYEKGAGKAQVTVDHRKLPAAQVQEMKEYWKERLDALKAVVERPAIRR